MQPRLLLPFYLLLHSFHGQENGIYFADSTKLALLHGKMFADKGYLSKSLLERLWQRGLHLMTGIRRNMKNYLMPLMDKVLLRKRFVIETLFDKLKSSMGLRAHPAPLPRQCPGPYSLFPGSLHPGTTQGQHRQYRHPQHLHTIPSSS